jgi:RimJ/RimL family protein N-acetyltransferase
VIETERLRLRLPRRDDAAALGEALADAEVMRYIRLGETTASRDDAEKAIDRYLAAWEADGFGPLMVVRRSDDAVVGRVALLAWDPRTWLPGRRSEIGEEAEIEIGWMLLRRHWGAGFATEATRALRRWAWENVELRRLISLIHPENERSIAVARRLGAHRDGTAALEWGSAELYVHPDRGASA